MSGRFVEELEASNNVWLAKIGEIRAIGGGASDKPATEVKIVPLLRVALANEISVSELAAAWMPDTTEWTIKIALARQAGDEARHFQTIEGRLRELGVALDDFTPPPDNPLFAYLKGLRDPVARIAAGMMTLESVAYRVNEAFILHCERLGDSETARLYRTYIQPDELHHHELGKALLAKYATTADAERRAREAATRTLELALDLRTKAAQRVGTHCFPGC